MKSPGPSPSCPKYLEKRPDGSKRRSLKPWAERIATLPSARRARPRTSQTMWAESWVGSPAVPCPPSTISGSGAMVQKRPGGMLRGVVLDDLDPRGIPDLEISFRAPGIGSAFACRRREGQREGEGHDRSVGQGGGPKRRRGRGGGGGVVFLAESWGLLSVRSLSGRVGRSRPLSVRLNQSPLVSAHVSPPHPSRLIR